MPSRLCTRCKMLKPSDQFSSRNSRNPETYQPRCKQCRNEIMTAWRRDNPEKYKAYRKNYRQKNIGRYRAIERKAKYGITQEEYIILFARQGECCGICKRLDAKNNGNDWHTDHNPVTGKVRGILCSPCNRLVSRHATPEILRNAANYLAYWIYSSE